MRMHHLIEQMDDVMKAHKAGNIRARDEGKDILESINKVDLTLNMLKSTFDYWAQIDIGNLYEEIGEDECCELAAYSTEMIQHGMEISPYPSIALSYKFEYQMLAFIKKGENGFEIMTFQDSGNKQLGNGIVGKIAIEKDGLQAYDVGWWVKPPKDAPAVDGIYTLRHIFSVYLITCAIMNSKDAKIVTSPAPAALNKKRAKKGRPPIGEIKEIRIQFGGKTYQMNGHEHGGHHAQKRLHWRRGHIRRLASGNITNVRPCLVGAIEGERAPMPSYRVLKGAA